MFIYEHDKPYKGIQKLRIMLILKSTLPYIPSGSKNGSKVIEKIESLVHQKKGRLFLDIIANKV